jgi:two-component sensor histidine kinase
MVSSIDPSILSHDEPARMSAVRRYDVLDTPPDGAFDRITAIAARRFNVPISIISIVDNDRIWFKSHHGFDVQQIGRDPGLCASAILFSEPWVLPDARRDIRSLANPLVAGEFGLRFYVGVPLRTHDGYNLGTLCVIDKEPRTIDEKQIADLSDLASVVMDQMELRLSALRAAGQARLMSREIDHRVMNSLQFVSALLVMQGKASGSPDASKHLEIAAHRVAAVARVHRHFYLNEPTEQVGCLTYLRRLCADLSGILEADIAVEGIEAIVPTTQIQPIGLIVNELVTNAAKHRAGSITVTFAPNSDGAYAICVMDEGEGLPSGFDPFNESHGLGMRLVSTLSTQLNGTLAAGPNPDGSGARFTITFPPVAGQTR